MTLRSDCRFSNDSLQPTKQPSFISLDGLMLTAKSQESHSKGALAVSIGPGFRCGPGFRKRPAKLDHTYEERVT
jgi:hypothetical protein